MSYHKPRRQAVSRRAKQERNRALKHIAVFSGFGLGLLALFIFGIVPLSLKILDLIDAGRVAQTGPSDTIPPSTPSISLPFSATNSAKINVQGYTEPKAQVSILVNGIEAEKTEVNEAGQFEAIVELDQGENSVKAVSTDEAGNQSPPSQEKVVIFDSQPPIIKLTNLVDGQEVIGKQHKELIIEGETEPQAKVFFNERFTYAREDGSFKFNLTLKEGENSLKIKVVDKAGNTSVTKLNIKFKP